MVRILALLAMVTTGTATSQLPEFAQQYRQRLGGAIDALEQVMADFRQDASQHGLSVSEAIDRQKASSDPFVQARGQSMAIADARLSNLKQQQADMENAGPIRRITVFMQDVDSELAQATAEDYVPAVPVSVAGFVSAAIGALGGLAVVSLIGGFFRIIFRRRRSA